MNFSKSLNVLKASQFFALSAAALGLTLGAAAQDGKTLSDAQVEANVLRALASAPELSTQNIQTTTVYGVVTITGSANDEASRTRAENLIARAAGVKKVVDQMGIGVATTDAPGGSPGSSLPANAQTMQAAPDGTPQAVPSGAVNAPGPGMVLQSDGTYAPAPAGDALQPAAGAQQPDLNAQQATEQGAPAPAAQAAPSQQAANPNDNGNPNVRRPMYGRNGYYPPQGEVEGGQQAGQVVTVPSGALLRVRINQGLSTKRSQVGMNFDGTVLSDVVAGGAVAIPRGAMVHGTVVKVEDAGVLKGRGDLALQINGLSLGGRNYTLVSDTWERNGKDKSLHTVNSGIAGGALGALFGAAAGGGAGAAIGAGVGGALGVASSAASPDGKVIIPPEAVLSFHLAQPATVTTVSEAEMSRLSYAAGPGQGQPVVRRRPYPVYYGPYPYGPY